MGSKTALILLLASPGLAKTIFKAPLYDFLTRPDLRAPRLFVDSYNATATAPGYLFISPFAPEVPPTSQDEGVNFDFGPMIYDNHGELVWTGANLTHPLLGTMGHFVCEYDGEPHLCYSHYVKQNPIHSDFLNSSYDVVRSVWPAGESSGHELNPDLHEFNVIAGSNATSAELPPNIHRNATAIITSDAVRELAIPEWFESCGREVRWVQSSVFQEVSVDGEERVLFQWDSYDHIPVSDVVQCPGRDMVYKDGSSEDMAFDYFHMNAVDKDSNGDYYISARHTSSLYKVSGQNGTVLWRMGLRSSNFRELSEVPGVKLAFAYQHHVRVHEDYPGADPARGIVALSIFDNANDDYDYYDKIASFSSGKVMLVDEHNLTAVLKEAYTLHLDQTHQLGANQGSFQLLPNGNRILGGGNIQEIIEWQPGNFEPVFRAHWGDWGLTADGHPGHKVNSYRSMRFPWRGEPRTAPAVFAYAPNCSSPQARAHASWNGATEVASWMFFGAAAPEGPWRQLGFAGRTGFETASPPLVFSNYVRAVAHDAAFRELARSAPVRVSVPAAKYVRERECGEDRCSAGFDYRRRAATVCAPRDPAAELGAPQVALSVGEGPSKLCDPCFGPYRALKRLLLG